MDDKNVKPNSEAEVSPAKPPVDTHDEAAVLVEFRRLKKKINRLLRELRAEQYRTKAFKKLFYEEPKYEDVRELVLSFADEHAIIRDEVEDRRRWKKMERDEAKKRTEEIVDKFALIGGDIETAQIIFSDCTDSEKHDRMSAYTYWSVDEELTATLQLSPEAFEILRAFDRYEYNNNHKHTRSEYRHLFPQDWRKADNGKNEDDDNEDEKCAENLPDNGTRPIELIIKEARLECEKITLRYHERHLEEVKMTLRQLPKKQAKRYYLHFYEGKGVNAIAHEEDVAPSTVSESLDSAKKNIMLFNIELAPSEELRKKFWEEINPWKDIILFYNGGLR